MSAAHKGLVLSAEVDDGHEVWATIARNYVAFASPFVPCRQDIEAYERIISLQAQARLPGPLRAVMLGVTPSLALMKWPAGSEVLAVEISQPVIDALWPGDVPGVRRAIRASWFSIPMDRGSCDVVVGDGSLATCRFPREVRALADGIHQLLADDGLFVFRSYVRPRQRESVEAVFDALLCNEGLSVDCFKMRLYMAMQRTAEEGVAVRDAFRILRKFNLNRRVMGERLGWSSAATEPFEAWATSDAVYSIPSLDELLESLDECFHEVSITYPDYELGYCCPTVAMRSRRP